MCRFQLNFRLIFVPHIRTKNADSSHELHVCQNVKAVNVLPFLVQKKLRHTNSASRAFASTTFWFKCDS